jgi:hypothetical protein
VQGNYIVGITRKKNNSDADHFTRQRFPDTGETFQKEERIPNEFVMLSSCNGKIVLAS